MVRNERRNTKFSNEHSQNKGVETNHTKSQTACSWDRFGRSLQQNARLPQTNVVFRTRCFHEFRKHVSPSSGVCHGHRTVERKTSVGEADRSTVRSRMALKRFSDMSNTDSVWLCSGFGPSRSRTIFRVMPRPHALKPDPNLWVPFNIVVHSGE